MIKEKDIDIDESPAVQSIQEIEGVTYQLDQVEVSEKVEKIKKTFNFYCGESTHLQNDGQPYMIISYVSVPYNELKMHKNCLKELRAKHKIKGESKWINVSTSQYAYYSDLVDYFFKNNLKFRAVILEKSQIDDHVGGSSYEDLYFKMYYQLLHHKLDLSNSHNVYLDIKDTKSHKRLKQLKDLLKYNASISNCQYMKSHESPFMQLTDIIMGALNYKLRGMNTVIAKNKLIEKIQVHCPFPLDQSTSKHADKVNLFHIDLK